MNYFLDTCAIIWAASNPKALSENARQALTSPLACFHVSPISVAELACGVSRGRISFEEHWRKWFRTYVDRNGWLITNVTLDIMEEAYSLPEHFHNDPADRIIVASARSLNASLITGDKKILDYPHVKTVW